MKKQFTILLILIFAFSLMSFNFVNAESLNERLKGKILLQVEGVGQAWYIDPATKERAFLGRPADAFRIMRELGLGISEDSYDSFNGYAPSRLSGKILLRVEANGEAYYVFPDDLKMYYLGRPADAFKVMREKGLGITNEDLNKVAIFQKYKQQTEANTTTINSLNQKVEEQQNKISELEEKIKNTNSATSTNSCAADTWTCGDWSECSADGQQTRTCNLTYDCESVSTPSPVTTQNCSFSSININNCIADTWTCGTWYECSLSGQQTRACNLIYDCPNANTLSPATNQSCTPPHTPKKILQIQADKHYSGYFDIYVYYYEDEIKKDTIVTISSDDSGEFGGHPRSYNTSQDDEHQIYPLCSGGIVADLAGGRRGNPISCPTKPSGYDGKPAANFSYTPAKIGTITITATAEGISTTKILINQ